LLHEELNEFQKRALKKRYAYPCMSTSFLVYGLWLFKTSDANPLRFHSSTWKGPECRSSGLRQFSTDSGVVLVASSRLRQNCPFSRRSRINFFRSPILNFLLRHHYITNGETRLPIGHAVNSIRQTNILNPHQTLTYITPSTIKLPRMRLLQSNE